jgi:hypothetical protein
LRRTCGRDGEPGRRRHGRLDGHADSLGVETVTNLWQRYRCAGASSRSKPPTTGRPQERHSIGIPPAKAAGSQ